MTAMLPDQPEIDPAVLASTEFSKARRGLEPTEVRAALGRAADALRSWQLRDQHHAEQIADLQKRLTAAEQLDEAHVASVLGEETARIVTAAREAATEIRSKAEEQAERMIREADAQATAAAEALRSDAQTLHDEAAAIKQSAQAEAASLRERTTEETSTLLRSTEEQVAKAKAEAEAEAATVREDAAAMATSTVSAAQDRRDELIGAAETVLAERTAEAEAAAAEIRAEATTTLERAESEAGSTLSSAREKAEQLRRDAESDAEERLEAARLRGVEMVEEAKAVRERMLTDLAERRRVARRQIEAAIAGRDRIVELLGEAHSHVASTIDGLDRAHADAAEAADAAASAVEDSLDEELAELTSMTVDVPAATEERTAASPEDRKVLEEPADGADGPADAVAASVDDTVAEATDDTVAEATDDTVAEATDDTVAEATDDSAAEVVDDEPEQVDSDGATAATDDADDAAAAADQDESDPVGAAPDEAASAEADVDEPAHDDSDAVAEVVEITEFQSAPSDADPAASSDLDDVEAAEHDVESDSDDGAEGATVHDLFERIRAATPDLADDDAIDLTEGARSEAAADGAPATAAGPTGVDAAESSEAEPVVEVAAVAVLDVQAATDHDLLDLRDEQLVPIERSLARVLKRIASDEQNEVLDRLRRVKRGRPDPDAVLPAPSVDLYVESLEAEFAEAIASGTRLWGDLVGSTVEPLSALDDISRDQLRSRVEEFVETHHAHLTKTFTDAEMAGLDTSDIGDRLRAAYRDWRSASLGGFAGDLATAGFTRGEQLAAGDGTMWRWVVDNGGLGCADGEDNALAGAVACSSPFPTGDLTPPAHPGCRCILAPAR